ncbi:MAG: hypothetical protein EWM72_02318 [Nitrospira sp.]|nr:MAG: hypothetical protein EWM72_02318 [Nitrospira sp.]
MNATRRLGCIGVMLAFVLVGCASGTPRELVECNDHAGLAAWYQQEALRLRAKAAEEAEALDKMHRERSEAIP